MKNIIGKCTAWYGNLKLQSKFTIALLLIVCVPAILVSVFFYTRLYDMVVSDTIRREQDSSAKTAPLIDDTVDEVLDAASQVTSLDFYRTLFHMPVNKSFSFLA